MVWEINVELLADNAEDKITGMPTSRSGLNSTVYIEFVNDIYNKDISNFLELVGEKHSVNRFLAKNSKRVLKELKDIDTTRLYKM